MHGCIRNCLKKTHYFFEVPKWFRLNLQFHVMKMHSTKHMAHEQQKSTREIKHIIPNNYTCTGLTVLIQTALIDWRPQRSVVGI